MSRRVAINETALEIVERRTFSGKVFDLGNGKKRFASRVGPSHVPTDVPAWLRGEPVSWNDPDIDVKLNARGRLGILNGYYDFEVLTGEIGFTYTSKSGGFLSVRLVEINGIAVGAVNNPVVRDGKIWWDEVRPGLDMFMSAAILKLEIFKKLKSDAAPRSFTWEVEESDPPILSLKTQTFGWDNYDYSNQERAGAGLGRVRRWLEIDVQQTPFQRAREGIRRYRVTETWTGRTYVRDRTARMARSFFNDYLYPVVIDQDVSEVIAADVDDGYQVGTTTWANDYGPSGANYSIIYTSGPRRPGFRFQTVAIPQAATIDAATFTIWTAGTGSATGGPLFGNDVDDAPQWATNAGPQNMTPTTATLTWTVPGGAAGQSYAVNVAAIVQEIVDRAGWATGNDIAFGVQGTVTGGYRYIHDFADPNNFDATLTVDYTEGGGGDVNRIRFPAEVSGMGVGGMLGGNRVQ